MIGAIGFAFTGYVDDVEYADIVARQSVGRQDALE